VFIVLGIVETVLKWNNKVLDHIDVKEGKEEKTSI
jgi:hypothetical protein